MYTIDGTCSLHLWTPFHCSLHGPTTTHHHPHTITHTPSSTHHTCSLPSVEKMKMNCFKLFAMQKFHFQEALMPTQSASWTRYVINYTYSPRVHIINLIIFVNNVLTLTLMILLLFKTFNNGIYNSLNNFNQKNH